MKPSFFLIYCLCFFVLSCNNSRKQPEDATTTGDTSKPVENKVQIPKSLCYANTSGKDTIRLNVDIFENVVTGNLVYKLYQKDSNTGEFEGKLYKDTLLANYTFMSEGKQSSRQVIFLISDSTAVEGYGEVEEKAGKMIFKDATKVKFGKGLKLGKVSCN